jgi:hypothetical protein
MHLQRVLVGIGLAAAVEANVRDMFFGALRATTRTG